MMSDSLRRERNAKEALYFRPYDTFMANYKKSAMTLKFYAKHEGGLVLANPSILENIIKARREVPKDKYQFPVTENQQYGWVSKFLEENPRFNYHRIFTPLTKQGILIQKEDKYEKKFVGIPFKLQ